MLLLKPGSSCCCLGQLCISRTGLDLIGTILQQVNLRLMVPDLLVQRPPSPSLTSKKGLCAGLLLQQVWLKLLDALMQQSF